MQKTASKAKKKNRRRTSAAAQSATAGCHRGVVTEIMTTPEAAAYLKLSPQFLEGARWRGDGSGPDYVRFGRSVRYRKSVLDAWVAKRAHSADKPSAA